MSEVLCMILQVAKLEEELGSLKQELLDQKNLHAEALQQADNVQKGADAQQKEAESLHQQAWILLVLTSRCFNLFCCLHIADHDTNVFVKG